MTLPGPIAEAVIRAAAVELANRAASDLDDMALVPISKAAEILGVSKRVAQRLICEHVELGEATKRYKLSTIRRVIDSRTFNSLP